jgi:hypothetical protein
MTGSPRDKKFHDLIDGTRVSKDLSPDKADEIARILPVMAVNAPHIIAMLVSAGLPVGDAEDAISNAIKLLHVVSEVHGQGPVSEAINKVAERKRNSSYAAKRRGKKEGKDAFDLLALEAATKNPGANADRVWDKMKERIETGCAGGHDLFIDSGQICLDRPGKKPRRISKGSFSTLLSKIKNL